MKILKFPIKNLKHNKPETESTAPATEHDDLWLSFIIDKMEDLDREQKRLSNLFWRLARGIEKLTEKDT